MAHEHVTGHNYTTIPHAQHTGVNMCPYVVDIIIFYPCDVSHMWVITPYLLCLCRVKNGVILLCPKHGFQGEPPYPPLVIFKLSQN